MCKKEQINILKDPLYFRKIKLDYMKCSYNQCVCDGLLKIYKAKKWNYLSAFITKMT